MLVMYAQFVFCLPCTNFSPHCCTPGFTQSLTFVSQLTKRVQTLTSNSGSLDGVQNAGATLQRNGVFPMFISTVDFTKTFDRVKLECVETL